MRDGYSRRGGGGNGRGDQAFDPRGRIALWQCDYQTQGAPDFTGTYTDDGGKKWLVSLWERRGARGNDPVFSGTIQDPDRVPRRDDSRRPYWRDDKPRDQRQSYGRPDRDARDDRGSRGYGSDPRRDDPPPPRSEADYGQRRDVDDSEAPF